MTSSAASPRVTMSARPDPAVLADLRRNWFLLAGAFLAACIGPTTVGGYTAGVFVPQLEHAFGWTRTQITFGHTLSTAVVSLLSPFAGWLADRIGVRVMFPAAALVFAGLLFSLSFLTGDYSVYLMTMLAMGVFTTGASTLIISRVIARGFHAARGTALGIGLAGIGVSSMLAPPIVSAAVTGHGWRYAYQLLAVIMILGLPLIVFPIWRHERPRQTPDAAPSPIDAEPQPSLRSMVLSPTFGKLALAFLLIQVSVAGMVLHFFPMQVGLGIPAPTAAFYAGIVGATMIVSRLIIGVLLDHTPARLVAALVTLVSALGLGLLSTGVGALASASGAIAIGLLLGAELDVAAFLVAQYYPPAAFGRIYGVLYSVLTTGVLISGLYYAIWYDRAKTYSPALLTAVALMILAAIALLLLPKYGKAH